MGTDFNYNDTSHQVISDEINGGAGSDALQQTSQEWWQLGGDIGETGKSYVQSAIRTIVGDLPTHRATGDRRRLLRGSTCAAPQLS